MSLTPLIAAPAIVQAHALAAVLALAFAILQMLRRKSGSTHRLAGWGFVLAMAVTAVSSFWIAGLRQGQYSPIHLLSVATLVTLPLAIIARRQGNIRRHKRAMLGLVAGLVGAGVFTLLPGRILHHAVFGF
jgi:uncharacterized membrane protein